MIPFVPVLAPNAGTRLPAMAHIQGQLSASLTPLGRSAEFCADRPLAAECAFVRTQPPESLPNLICGRGVNNCKNHQSRLFAAPIFAVRMIYPYDNLVCGFVFELSAEKAIVQIFQLGSRGRPLRTVSKVSLCRLRKAFEDSQKESSDR